MYVDKGVRQSKCEHRMTGLEASPLRGLLLSCFPDLNLQAYYKRVWGLCCLSCNGLLSRTIS